MSHIIKNFDTLATTQNRQIALSIAEAGLAAIDTQKVIKNSLKISGQILTIGKQQFNLDNFENIKVIAFGKAASTASMALEKIFGSRLNFGISLGIVPSDCKIIKSFAGSHPLPTEKNAEISDQIAELAKNASAKDLVIVVVSGGGSALLCWPLAECQQANTLYAKFLKTGGTIAEMNLIRKHISKIKGGGLAKLLYPATVVGLIFSDIPGDEYEMVASGPTFLDSSTIYDAQKIIDRYQLPAFELNETPKEKKYFEKVFNIPLVSNQTALQAMAKAATSRGLKSKIISAQLYDEQDAALWRMFNESEKNLVVLAGGETSLKITRPGGTGGRNMNLAMKALIHLETNDVFIALGSDGLDNSKAAGGIADIATKQKAVKLNVRDYIDRFDAYTFCEKTDSVIMTGPTGANVSDLMLLLRR